jgi:hypothetical protein
MVENRARAKLRNPLPILVTPLDELLIWFPFRAVERLPLLIVVDIKDLAGNGLHTNRARFPQPPLAECLDNGLLGTVRMALQ